jgi:cobyrinic acid a,c-diamide synthase
MNQTVSCPALMIAAPASGQGKTMITAALARLHHRQGRRVKVFKCGPDFLDPQIHAIASGAPCENLDFRMGGEVDVAWRLARAARDNDVILIEGVMGLFDGEPSAADLARRFNLPILVVIDGSAMARSFGAIALGMKTYEPDTRVVGALANCVGSAYHAQLLEQSLPEGIAWFGAVPRSAESALPERHLGLLPAAEITDLAQRIDQLADRIAETAAAALPPVATFPDTPMPEVPALLAGKTIAVARDAAFCFAYPANIECLKAMGASLRFFSPLHDATLPDCDAVWLPGGYPELHPDALANNRSMIASLQTHIQAGKPVLAECGGMIALAETLVDIDGTQHPLMGILPGTVQMQKKLAALGMQSLTLSGGRLGGHTFHYSTFDCPLEPIAHTQDTHQKQSEAVYGINRLTATYFHAYFPSAPRVVADLLHD